RFAMRENRLLDLSERAETTQKLFSPRLRTDDELVVHERCASDIGHEPSVSGSANTMGARHDGPCKPAGGRGGGRPWHYRSRPWPVRRFMARSNGCCG